MRSQRTITLDGQAIPPFQSFLEDHRTVVYRFLLASVGPAEADDCFQETFLAALRAYPKLENGDNLRAWILAIATRKAIDAARARNRRPDPVAVFDVIVNNADRKGGHCMRGRDGTIWVVDHGVCFSPEPKLRTVIWDFAGEPVPDPILADVRRLAEGLRWGPLREEMLGLLSAGEIDATADRARRLAASGRFPQPGARRAYPWPPL